MSRTPTRTDDDFALFGDVVTWRKSGDEHEMRIGGIVSTDGIDRQAERVLADGLDFSQFLSHGWFNDNHKQGTGDVVGYPTGVKRVRKGDKLPNGETSRVNGWWSEGYLLDTPKGRELYDLIHALDSTPRKLGFSIEGSVVQRTGSTIKAASVRNVAVTHCPVNAETSLMALAKALTAGGDIANPGAAPGEGFALRTEGMDPGLMISGPELDIDPATGKRRRKRRDGSVSKGDNPSGLSPMTDVQLVEEWASALVGLSPEADDPDRATLTKSQAAHLAADLLPYGDAAARRALSHQLSGVTP